MNNLNNFNLKNEPELNSYDDDISEQRKCAEIYISDNEKFIFSCIWCSSKFSEFSEFEKHIMLEHFVSIKSNKKCPQIKYELTRQIEDCVTIITDAANSMNELVTNRAVKNSSPLCAKESDIKEEIDFQDQLLSSEVKLTSKTLIENYDKESEEENETDILDLNSINELPPIIVTGEQIKSLGKKEKKNCEKPKRNRKKIVENSDGIEKPKRVYNWNRVYKTIEINGEVKYPCEICDKPFNTRSYLRKHERIHKGNWKPHPCHFCGKVLRTGSLLKNHIRIHTDERPYKCDMCDKTFRTSSCLINHKIYHSDIKRFQCQFCAMKFHIKAHKVTHERIHTGEKPYICDNCGDKFSSYAGLSEHKKTHLDVQPRKYACEICKYSFPRRTSLKRHMLVHSDERNHVCSTCGAAYKGKKELVQHQKIHQGTNEYRCKICGLEFVRYSRVRDHIKIKHGPDIKVRANVDYTPANQPST